MQDRLWAPWRVEYIERADDSSSECVFCHPEDSLIVHRSDKAVALLNRFPYSPGHVLVAPLRHVGAFGDLTDEEALEIHRLGAGSIAALTDAYAPDGHNLGWNLGRAAGAAIVDHVHLHVVPRWIGDTNFMPVIADIRVLPEALDATALRLRASWSKL